MPPSRNLSRPRRAKNNPSEVSAPKRLRRLTLHHNVKKSVSFEKGAKKSERIVLKKSEKKASTKGKIKFVSSRIISIISKQIFLPSLSLPYTATTINLDPESLLDSINKHESIFMPTDDSRLAIAALPHTQQHEYLIDAVTNDFLLCLANVPNLKWTEALKPVKFKTFGKKTSHPKILVDIGGEKTHTKIMIANKALIDWMASMKKKSPGAKCIWYQPSTQNQRLRTFLGSCSKLYDWSFEISDFNFKGGLKGFIDKLYAKRFQEFACVS